MSNKPLDFSALDQAASAGHGRRCKSRDVNPVVQMSLRMSESIYERFRKHCEEDRRTNGGNAGDHAGCLRKAATRSQQTFPEVT